MQVDLSALLSTPNAILAVAFVLGACIFVHELGHFLAARANGIPVEEFAIGLGPVIFRRRRGETVYSLRLIPFGGFARIAGMEPGEQDLPNGLYAKPKWVQAMVFTGGAFMNIVLAMVMFAVVIFWQGVPVEGAREVVVNKVLPGTPAQRAGLQPGDRIVAVDGCTLSTVVSEAQPGGLAAGLGMDEDAQLYYVAGRRVAAAAEIADAVADAGPGQIAVIWIPPEVTRPKEMFRRSSIPASSADVQAMAAASTAAAKEAAVQRWLGCKFEPLSVGSIADYVALRPGERIELTIRRGDQLLTIPITPRRVWERVVEPGPGGKVLTPHRQVGRIGVVLTVPRRRPGLLEGLWLATRDTVGSIVAMVGALRAMIAREISPDVGGFVAIVAMTAEQAKIGWAAVFQWTGLISANLAVLNLLPVPPLDGFYMVLLGWEILTRRRVSERVRIAIVAAGVVFVILVAALITYRDIVNLIKYRTP